MDSSPPLAGIALSLMVQDWSVLGLGDDPSVAASSDVDVVVERVTALLLVRIVAVQSPLGTFSDLSTATICRTVMMKSQKWPESITPEIIEQLRDYVKKMLEGYKDVPYHNFEHANHVIVSINKLLDLVLTAGNGNKHQRPPPSFGLRHDPLNQLALVFAAMVHDVEHQGIPNRQLAIEDDRLAILYNDQSIAENWSLYIAFSELLQDEYKSLREVMCGGGPGGYTYFRKTVVNLVLNTDIASPERTQISKSKWKEAFGDPYETVERKVRHEARRMSLTGQDVQIRMDRRASATSRRGTHFSEVSNEDFTDDGSLSGTPDGSVDDEEPYEVTAVASKDSSELLTTQSMHVYSNSPAAGADMGTSAHPPTTRFGRRFSTSSRATTASKYKQRLGILRTVDLSGETLETYSRASMGQASAVSSDKANTVNIDMDEPDELKMTVSRPIAPTNGTLNRMFPSSPHSPGCLFLCFNRS